MKKLIILSIAVFTLLSCCKKEDPDPCPTCPKTEFRCKIDGMDYVPYCEPDIIFGCTATRAQYYNDTKSLEIVSGNDKTNWSIAIRKHGLKIGKNVLSVRGGGVGNATAPGNCGSYDLDTTKLNILTILEIDTIKSIIEGEFDFYTFEDSEGCEKESVHVTEGYFKVSY